MVRVVAFLPDSRAQKRLAAALALRARSWSPSVAFAAGWAEVHRVADCSAPDLLVFDPYATGRFDGEPVGRFAGEFRSCALVGYSSFPRGSARDVLELSRIGVHSVATQDVDDSPAGLAELLERARECGTLVQALSLLEPQASPGVRDLLPILLFRTHENLAPAQAARLCHCHPKTLRAHLRSAGLPSLGKLIVWARLIRACHLLQDAGRSVESVALTLGFASVNSFRNQLFRYVGIRPTDLRGWCTTHFVLGRFQAALARGRALESSSPECD